MTRIPVAACTAEQAHLLRPHVQKYLEAIDGLAAAVRTVFPDAMAVPGARFDAATFCVWAPAADTPPDEPNPAEETPEHAEETPQ